MWAEFFTQWVSNRKYPCSLLSSTQTLIPVSFHNGFATLFLMILLVDFGDSVCELGLNLNYPTVRMTTAEHAKTFVHLAPQILII